MGQVYSKAKPHLPLLNEVALAVNLPEELIRHQWIVETDAATPETILPMAERMRTLVERYYPLKKKGYSWRDVYGLAAAAFKLGNQKVEQAIINARSASWDVVSDHLPRKTVDYVDASRKSVFWDFESESGWGWFDLNFKPPKRKFFLGLALAVLIALGLGWAAKKLKK